MPPTLRGRSRIREKALFALLLIPIALAAQQPMPVKTPTVLWGKVSDDATGVPIGGVTVGIVGAPNEVRTDARGYFAFGLPEVQRIVVTFSRLGYAAATRLVDVVLGDTTRASFFLLPRAATLGAVTVTAKEPSTSARLADFERRRAVSVGGTFLTHAEIEKRNPISTTDLFRRIAGVSVADSVDGQLSIRMLVSSRGKIMRWNPRLRTHDLVPCYLQIGVDGRMMPVGFSVDEIDPKDIHGIEVYSGPSTMPRELMMLDTDGFCGLVMIWTRIDH